MAIELLDCPCCGGKAISRDVDALNKRISDSKYENLTVMVMRIIEHTRLYGSDADGIQAEFLSTIGDFERNLAKREGIELIE